MGLNFDSAGSGRLVNIGSAAVLDNIEVGTIAAWVRPITTTSILVVFCKDTGPGASPIRCFWVDITNNDIEFSHDRATTDLDVRSTTGIPLNVWSFIAVTWNTAGASADQRLFYGRYDKPVAELAYAAQTVGSGAVTSDASWSGIVGNQGGGSREFRGDMAWIGIYNRTLLLDELESLRKQLFVAPSCLVHMHLGYESEAMRQLDLSGWGNHGTPTATPVRSPHPPFLNPVQGWRKREVIWMPEAAAGGSGAVRGLVGFGGGLVGGPFGGLAG